MSQLTAAIAAFSLLFSSFFAPHTPPPAHARPDTLIKAPYPLPTIAAPTPSPAPSNTPGVCVPIRGQKDPCDSGGALPGH